MRATHHECPSCLPKRRTRIPIGQRLCDACQRLDEEQRGRMAALEQESKRHRSGKHTSPRILLTLEPELLAQIDAECERDGTPRSDWLREACRAYLLLKKRDKLTDADWRRVVSG